MNMQVIIATMNQCDYSLLDKMNIQTEAIVCNQCNKNEITEFNYKNNKIKWLSFDEKGVGLNRNNGLMRANSDIVTFADDDMIFVNNYEKIIIDAFNHLKKADIIIFDLIYPKNPRRPIKKIEKLNSIKCMRFGAARISARLNSLKINGISFNLCFGGGTEYSSGEDSLFLLECLRKGLNIYSYPVVIANLLDRESSWFNGYNDKYFFDKGVLFSSLYPKLCYLYAVIHCYKQRSKYQEYGVNNAFRQILKGIRHRRYYL